MLRLRESADGRAWGGFWFGALRAARNAGHRGLTNRLEDVAVIQFVVGPASEAVPFMAKKAVGDGAAGLKPRPPLFRAREIQSGPLAIGLSRLTCARHHL